MAVRYIELRGVRVHNLNSVDLDLPHRSLIVFCGVSGSGKTSLALDTLYAEGQRRYIESFSAYTRQFLERLEKPEAERIDAIPPAIAVTRKGTTRSNRATIASTTEIASYLQLLFAKVGRVFCVGCSREVRRETPQSAADRLSQLPDGTRWMLTFPQRLDDQDDVADVTAQLQSDGFVRVVAGERLLHLASDDLGRLLSGPAPERTLHVVTDRLAAGTTNPVRLRDSLETAFARGGGTCHAWVLRNGGAAGRVIEGRNWQQLAFHSSFRCGPCQRDYPAPEPRLYDPNSPLGACPECEGFGNVVDLDMDLIVPRSGKSIRDGAIAPWNTPAYAHELEQLLALADDYQLPVDIPFQDLTDEHLKLIRDGIPERNFGGLRGFFEWLERRKYKMHIRVFLSRWRSYRPCPTCNGQRLREEALATRVGDRSIAEILGLKSRDAVDFFQSLQLTDWQRNVAKTMLAQIQSRLQYLSDVGLGFLTLDRTLRTLSGGESQRVAMTSALGSSLVNMLYVLDEPTVGLHPRDVQRLTDTIVRLRDRGNTVAVTEHEEAVLRRADLVVEFGPGAGESGGNVVFQGSPQEMQQPDASLTGEYLSGRRGAATPQQRRPRQRGVIQLTGARGNNLKNITVDFPLGMLCLVTGVSGSGKSTLVQDTLYGALCHRKRKDSPKPYPYDDVFGDGQIEDVILVDQSPIGRSPRSNPVTYVKAFDAIRAAFADTVEARTHNYTASHFSFNVDGGRCEACKGEGHVEVDMQFLPDVYMKCSQCRGTRYRREILEVTYRNRNIADVLEMTVREAFSFFRGQTKAQTKLKQLIDVGLDYLRLGQPANTLSSGEAQRLRLAAYMSRATRSRTLFLLDEPTTGLHFADVVRLLDCFDSLLAVGHSLIVVEHNLQMMKAADWIIDLGPDAAEDGGHVVAQGTPETVAACEQSITGRYLRQVLASAEQPSRSQTP